MTKRMLIDATHPEETRVVVLDGGRLDEFDCETSTKKQLKGNIYLAKITRVEPSLQAAFVEYGGSRHGFLAFNEIHPDYYQLPIADREALAAREGEADEDEPAAAAEERDGAEVGESAEARRDGDEVEVVGGDEVDEVGRRRSHSWRRYRMQEVIKRRQIMLVQVVKEERGTKGAALTTFISLAGRYCVLMPNTVRGGGISRKIIDPEDRKRLKAIIAELAVPEGMGMILRTAGMDRSKAEIKRDFNYLVGLWDATRELTLRMTAPAVVHEEANLIKRSIRDLYTREIEEVLVEGDEGYRMAKQFMRTLIPSHATRVKPYRERVPLFHRFQVENQLNAMHGPTVHLKSGGSIVISPTEALVTIDVNSGKATRERHIEETAYKTNLEAADEIARQLRLRDLAGLIVIDYIDMDETKSVRAVERRFKEAMKTDRARVQIGRISPFGLLELSRQRLRPSLLEASGQVCPYCNGSGHIRSIESAALHILRSIEEEGIQGRGGEITMFMSTAVALYIFNQKRGLLAAIEKRHGLDVTLAADDSLVPPDYRLERDKDRVRAKDVPEAEAAEEVGERAADSRRRRRPKRPATREPEAAPTAEAGAEEAVAPPDTGTEGVAETRADTGETGAEAPRKRRRRGKRGGRRRRAAEAVEAAQTPVEGETEPVAADQAAPVVEVAVEPQREAGAEDKPEAAPEKPKRSRRGGRGKKEAAPEKPRRGRRAPVAVEDSRAEGAAAEPEPTAAERAPVAAAEPEPEPAAEPLPANVEAAEQPAPIPAEATEKKPRRAARRADVAPAEAPDRETRRGWWQRLGM